MRCGPPYTLLPPIGDNRRRAAKAPPSPIGDTLSAAPPPYRGHPIAHSLYLRRSRDYNSHHAPRRKRRGLTPWRRRAGRMRREQTGRGFSPALRMRRRAQLRREGDAGRMRGRRARMRRAPPRPRPARPRPRQSVRGRRAGRTRLAGAPRSLPWPTLPPSSPWSLHPLPPPLRLPPVSHSPRSEAAGALAPPPAPVRAWRGLEGPGGPVGPEERGAGRGL